MSTKIPAFVITMVAAIALVAIDLRDAPAAPIVVPPDPSTLEATQLISNACSKCHGAGGVSVSSLFPNLAGQISAYIETELKMFRQRGRSDPRARAFMWGIARGLTDEQIKGVAQIFSGKPPAPAEGSINAALAEKGKTLYENGAKDRDIEACIVCHGRDGQGVNTQPRIAGQHRDYFLAQMLWFRSRLRENKVMQAVTHNLTDEEIQALVEYVSTK